MKPTRMIANIVAGMLLIQIVLGGLSVLLNFDVLYHIVWGILTFIVLLAATVLAARDYGRTSSVLKLGIAAIIDYVIQGILGLFSLHSDAMVVVHLTNAFILGVIATNFIGAAARVDQVARQTVTSLYGSIPAAQNLALPLLSGESEPF
jgi:heme A synthase